MAEIKYVRVLMCRMLLKSDAVSWTKRVTKFSHFPCTSLQRLCRGLLPLRAHPVKHTWNLMLRVRFGSNCEPCLPDYTHTAPVLFWTWGSIKKYARWESRQAVQRNVTLLCLQNWRNSTDPRDEGL